MIQTCRHEEIQVMQNAPSVLMLTTGQYEIDYNQVLHN